MMPSLKLLCLLFIWWCSSLDNLQCEAFIYFSAEPIMTSTLLSSPPEIAKSILNNKHYNKWFRRRLETQIEVKIQQAGQNPIKYGDFKEKDDFYNQYYHLIKLLLQKISSAGTDGTKIPQAQRQSILDLVQQLESLEKGHETNLLNVECGKTHSSLSFNSDMTAILLEGEHKLLYTDTPNTPQYIGPFKGKTTQRFIDESTFENVLQLGSFAKIVLTADRKTMDGKRIKLFFRRFAIIFFGMKVVEKDLDAKGVWKMIFVGEVEMEHCHSSIGSRKFLLRVMRTPNLYILAKEL